MLIQLTDGTRHLTIFGERQTTFQESFRWLFTRCYEAIAEFRLQECKENARNG